MLKHSSLAKWGVAVLLLSSLTSCEDILEQYFPKPNPTIPTFPNPNLDITFYALSGGTRLDAYSTKDPATRTGSVNITGLASGERILAMDFRPATGQLYGVSSASRIYVINHVTGAAHPIGFSPASAGAGPFTPTIVGNLVGFDFNPTVDRIRLVTSTGQNLRLNPETGAVVATDGSINGAAVTLAGAAYTNNTAGASTTVLYNLDPATDQLYRQDPPNEGNLVPVGALNLNITGDGGFDIDARSGTALGLYPVNGLPTLFTVDLTTGAARPLIQYNPSLGYSGIAIPTKPVAYAVSYIIQEDREGLFIFDPTNPNPANAILKPITGLIGRDFFVGLDFRPANGQLYAYTATGTFYTIDAATGAATFRFRAGLINNSTAYGFDLDPVTDYFRLISYPGALNIRVSATNGSTVLERRFSEGSNIVAAAYDNNFVGATTTTLYVLDGGTDKLYRMDPQNTGTLVEVGSLGVDVSADCTFDISGGNNSAYLITTFFGGPNLRGPKLYKVDLGTGKATAVIDDVIFAPGVGGTSGTVRGLALGLGL
jgi:hypothetical protein